VPPRSGDAMTDDEWLSAGDAAAVLGVTRLELYRMIDEGALPAYRRGHMVMLKVEDVNRLR